LPAAHYHKISLLLYIDWQIANCADETAAGFFPMKDLAGIERHRQIEIQCRNFQQSHWRIEQSLA
jgi:hypothetical protein